MCTTVRSVAIAAGLVLLLSAAGTMACGEAPAGTRATVRDSAGISIVENVSPDDSAAWVWWTVSGPEVDIGAVEGDEAQSLFRVADAHRRADGSMVVANGGSNELRLFDATGAYLASWGRRGGGPGEFQSINGLYAIAADTLLVFDARERRISVFTPEGLLARDFTLGPAGVSATPIDVLPDGDLVGWAFVVMQGDGPQDGLQRPETPVLRFRPDGVMRDTIGVFPGAERVIRVNARDGQILSINVLQPAFARTTYHAVAGNEVYVATQDAAEIRAFAPDGTLRRIVRTGRIPQPVTPQHVDAWIERMVASAPEAAREGIFEGMRDAPHGQTVPPYGPLLADEQGRLWVSDYNDPLATPGRWTLYDREGRGIARIALPERFVPYQIGADWILGRELDAFDVEHVRLYRISMPGASAGS